MIRVNKNDELHDETHRKACIGLGNFAKISVGNPASQFFIMQTSQRDLKI